MQETSLEYLTPAAMAALEGCSVATIRARLKAGHYTGAFQLQPSGYWRIPNPAYVAQASRSTPPAREPAATNLDLTTAKALGTLAALPTRPARAAAVALQHLTRTVQRHGMTADGGQVCACCLWPYPCEQLVDSLTTLEDTLAALGSDYTLGGVR